MCVVSYLSVVRMLSFLYLDMLLHFILIWTMVYLTQAGQWTTIKVDPIYGTDNQTCWTGNVSCKSLNYALQDANNNTTIQLSNGTINLFPSNTTLSNLVNITIVGTGITSTTIQCNISNTGLYFIRIYILTIANLTITNCGMLQNSTTWNNSSPVQYPTAVTIYNSSNISILSVSFRYNNGIGLSIINTGGFVIIRNSTFDSNYITNDNYPGGGGLYIEFPFCCTDELCDYSRSFSNFSSSNSHYIIDSCKFTNNNAKKMEALQFSNKGSFLYSQPTFGRGGGMSVFFRGNSTNNTVDINNTRFIHNTAVWGGGLYIEFSHYANRNTISIKNNSQFSNNHCHDNVNPENPGGGGVQIFYNFYNRKMIPKHNNVSFLQSYFVLNTAYWGGGLSYSLGKLHYAHGTNFLYFYNCSWYGNEAKFGAAVDLYRPLGTGVAQAVTFENCSFINNSAFYHLQKDQFELQGAGVMYVNSIIIGFKGSVRFMKNTGTALVLFTSYIYVMDECNVTFMQNKGWRGGAVSLLASSWIKVGENTTVLFDRNRADEVGGAIYTELSTEHKVVPQWNCFIQFSDPSFSPDDWSTKIQFQKNFAFFGGHAIYATTLRSCVWNKYSAFSDKDDIKSAFRWKSFEFNGEPGTKNFSMGFKIATAVNNLTTYQSAIMVAPGEKSHLPFKHLDDEGHNANVVFFVQSDNVSKGIVDNQSIYVYGDIMQVYGEPNTNFNITVTSLAPIPYTVMLNVTFDYCPPGYIAYKKGDYENSTSCKCGNLHRDGIPGISECNDTLYQAYITRYHWGGIHGTSGKFVTAVCPQGYCTFPKSKYSLLLPRKRSALDFFQCHKQYRTGDICGECMSDYTISSQSNCVKCTYGTLKGLGLFFVYECLPTIIFVTIILFLNVNITSGHWHSIIFYFQIVEILNLYALQSTEEYHEGYKILIIIHKYVFGIWNLEYYSPDVCYISGAKHVFFLYALQYFTVVIAFGVVLVLLVIKNLHCSCTIFKCNCQRNIEQNNRNNRRNPEGSYSNRLKKHCNKITEVYKQWFGSGNSKLIHGLATVLVLSYTKIALLSMKFFIPGPMYASYHEKVDTRVHHVGTMKYFHTDHLHYVIPATFFLFLAALLPFYLILKSFTSRYEDTWFKRFDKYRWCKKIKGYQFCKRIDKALYCCFSKGKGDEFLNEFYGSLKKDCHYYAGFFFIYRLALYATFAFTPSLMVQYCVQQCLLGFFLFVHSFLQPYNEHFASANKLDAAIFMNLIIINALSVYNFYSVIDIQSQSQAAIGVQLVFVYLPLLYIPFRAIWYCRNGQVFENNDQNQPLQDPTEGDIDPENAREEDRLLGDESLDFSSEYDKLDSLSRVNRLSTTHSTSTSYRRPPVIERIQNAN